MKKILIPFIFIIIIAIFVGCTNENERKYSSNSGRDTVISLGDTDGRFGVFRTANNYWDLFDVKNQKSIDLINNYKDVKPYIYTFGQKGYTKLNYDNGQYIQSTNLKDFTESDQKIFTNLEQTKDKVKK